MTHSSMTFGRPAHHVAIRGTAWLNTITAAMLAVLRRLDRWQLSLRQERAMSVQDVHDWAQRIQATDPGFAADLHAAAARATNGQEG